MAAILSVVYIGIALGTAGYVFYRGVLLQRPHMLIGRPEQVTLAFTCLLVGFAWILFTPVLLVRAGHDALPWLEERVHRWSPGELKAARARG